MSNKLTGEVDITIAGLPYTLKATPAAALALEEASPKTIAQLAEDIRGQRVRELALVILCGIQEKQRPTLAQIAEEAAVLRKRQDHTLLMAAMRFLGGFFDPDPEEGDAGKP